MWPLSGIEIRRRPGGPRGPGERKSQQHAQQGDEVLLGGRHRVGGCAYGDAAIVQGLELNAFARARLDASVAEVQREAAAVEALGLLA